MSYLKKRKSLPHEIKEESQYLKELWEQAGYPGSCATG